MTNSQSGYDRIPGDTYITPQWVWEALYREEPWAEGAWDCCPANANFDVLEMDVLPEEIATNSPYGRLGPKIVYHVLPKVRQAAFLFPIMWVAAKTRRGLINEWPFKKMYVLSERICWENLPDGHPKGIHAWFVWDMRYKSLDTYDYQPGIKVI